MSFGLNLNLKKKIRKEFLKINLILAEIDEMVENSRESEIKWPAEVEKYKTVLKNITELIKPFLD